LMADEILQIRLEPSTLDPALRTAEYQEELEVFDRALRVGGIVPQRILKELQASADTGKAVWLSDFIVVAKTLRPLVLPILAALVGYLRGKKGRSVSFTIGKDGQLKGSANTVGEAKELLKRLVAASSQQK